eukprot:UN01708
MSGITCWFIIALFPSLWSCWFFVVPLHILRTGLVQSCGGIKREYYR